MIFLFDVNVSARIPKALTTLKPPQSTQFLCLQDHFRQGVLDDEWLAQAGRQEWLVIGHDYRWHTRASELFAIQQHNVGCFYLWGAQSPTWDVAQVFMKAFDQIVEAAKNTPRPFIYFVDRKGRLKPVPFDGQPSGEARTA